MRGTYKDFLVEKERFNEWISETVTKILNERRSSPSEDGTKKFYLLKSYTPQNAIEVKKLADRWNTSFSEFKFIMQNNDFMFIVGWDVYTTYQPEYKISRHYSLFVFLKEVEDCENRYPQLKKEVERFEKRNALEKEFRDHKGEVYEALSCFKDVHWSFCIERYRFRTQSIINSFFMPPIDWRNQKEDQEFLPWGLFSRIIGMLKQGKSRSEIACKLRNMGLSRPIIGALLREDTNIISDYGQYADTLLKAESTEDDTILE